MSENEKRIAELESQILEIHEGNTKKRIEELEEAVKSLTATKIKGGHSDVNRSLGDRGLKPIYKDSDEMKHQTKESLQDKTKRLLDKIRDDKTPVEVR